MRTSSLVAILSLCSCAPRVEPFSEAEVMRFETALTQTVASQGAPGVLMLVEDGSHRWVGTSGVADLVTAEPVTEHTLFLTASVAKTFTAAVVLALVDEGRLSLDQTLDAWVPRVPGAEGITLRMLLNHTSGVASYNHVPGWDDVIASGRVGEQSADELVDLSLTVPPEFPPGEGWSYSNTGYILLGMIVEAVVGRSIVAETRARFFGPLGMNDTVPVTDAGDGLWSSYLSGSSGIEPVPSVAGYPADGGYVTSLHDLGIWARSFLAGRLHREDTIAAARMGAGGELLGSIAAAYGFETGGYGAGFVVASDARLGPLYAGGGNTDGGRTFVGYVPSRDLAFVVAVNVGEGRVPLIESISEAAPIADALRAGATE